MQSKKAVQLNMILNILAIVFILTVAVAGYWIYADPQTAKELYIMKVYYS